MLRQGLGRSQRSQTLRSALRGGPAFVCVSGGNRCLPFQEFIQFKENNAKLQESRGKSGVRFVFGSLPFCSRIQKTAQNPQKPRFRGAAEQRPGGVLRCTDGHCLHGTGPAGAGEQKGADSERGGGGAFWGKVSVAVEFDNCRLQEF